MQGQQQNAFFVIKVGQNQTFIGIYGVHTAILAGKSPYIRPYTVHFYGSGQPYLLAIRSLCSEHSSQSDQGLGNASKSKAFLGQA